MASINNNPASNASGNAQLVGIVNSVPMPRTGSPTLINGAPVIHDPLGGSLVIGAQGPGFTVGNPVVNSNPFGITLNGANGTAVTAGGITEPPMGAQPPAPGSPEAAAAAAAGTPMVTNATGTAAAGAAAVVSGAAAPAPAAAPAALDPVAVATQPDSTGAIKYVDPNAPKNTVRAPLAGVAANAGGGAPEATAVSESGFGKAERTKVMKVKVGGDAGFSFPPFNTSKKSVKAPEVSWGTGWKKVDKGDGFHYMEHTNGAKAVPAVEWRMTPAPIDGAKTVKVAHGWGKKFPDGTVLVFDKTQGPYILDAKGNKKKLGPGRHEFGGVKVRIFEATVVRVLEKNGAVSVFDSRGNHGAGTPRKVTDPASAAGGGAKMIGNAPQKLDQAALTERVKEMTGIARGLLAQIQGGKLDPAALASFQAQLSTLPDGVRQAIGAAGITTGDAAALGITGGGPTTTGAPVAGVNANPSSKTLAAGTKFPVPSGAPEGTVRFGQLPEDVQNAIASELGSTEGTGALEADTQIKISGGTGTLVASEQLYVRKQVMIAGGGPGDDLAMTMKPVRQKAWTGGGGSTSTPSATVPSGAHAGHTTAPGSANVPGVSGTTVSGGGAAADSATRKTIFGAGSGATIPALAGAASGTYTWATLPEAARKAITDYLATATTTTAGAAWSARGAGDWTIDPDATIIIGGAQATFTNGLAVTKPKDAAPAPAAPAAPAPGNAGAPPAPPSAAGSGNVNLPPPAAGGGTGGATPPAPASGHDHAGHTH